MEYYRKLNGYLTDYHSKDYVNDGHRELDNSSYKLKSKFQLIDTIYLPIIIWNYDIQRKVLKLTTDSFVYDNAHNTNLQKLLQTIKPCYAEYFVEFVITFHDFLLQITKQKQEIRYSIQCSLPMRMNSNEYSLVQLYVIPRGFFGYIDAIKFIALPIKEYENEVISIHVLENWKENTTITQSLLKKTPVRPILTTDQKAVFELLIKGCSREDVAKRLNKKEHNLKNLFFLIQNRISTFFEIQFNSLEEALGFYQKSFPFYE